MRSPAPTAGMRRLAPIPLLAGALALSACGDLPFGGSRPYRYDTLLPAVYEESPNERFPLILFLHGAGGLHPGDHVIAQYAAARADFPFIVVAPRTDEPWSLRRLDAVLGDVEARHRVDPDRIYVTGLSMGAIATWDLAAQHPRRFAAIALVAGGGRLEQACPLKHLPVWLFHNRADPVMPYELSRDLAEVLSECGARDARLTLYSSVPPGVHLHNAWQAAYTDPRLYAWFLGHSR